MNMMKVIIFSTLTESHFRDHEFHPEANFVVSEMPECSSVIVESETLLNFVSAIMKKKIKNVENAYM